MKYRKKLARHKFVDNRYNHKLLIYVYCHICIFTTPMNTKFITKPKNYIYCCKKIILIWFYFTKSVVDLSNKFSTCFDI